LGRRTGSATLAAEKLRLRVVELLSGIALQKREDGQNGVSDSRILTAANL
jgi:hypothetical protein